MQALPLRFSPLRYARLGGLIYLLIILLGAFAEGFINGSLVVGGNAPLTAQRILAAPQLWQQGVLANVLLVLLAVPLLWIEYYLLRPVSKPLAVLSLLLNGVSLAVEAVSKVFMLLVLPLLTSPAYAQAFRPSEVAGLAHLALRGHDVSFNVALLFFGGVCLVNGYLIRKSGYLPGVLGGLLQAAGAAYLVACGAALFAPTWANVLLPGLLLVPLVGESSLSLWLLLKGVDAQKWETRTAARPVLVGQAA